MYPPALYRLLHVDQRGVMDLTVGDLILTSSHHLWGLISDVLKHGTMARPRNIHEHELFIMWYLIRVSAVRELILFGYKCYLWVYMNINNDLLPSHVFRLSMIYKYAYWYRWVFNKLSVILVLFSRAVNVIYEYVIQISTNTKAMH